MSLSRMFFVALSWVTLLPACGGSDGGGGDGGRAEGTLNDQAYVVVDAGTLERTDTQLKGSGTVAFKAPISALGGKQNYALTFSLADGGSLQLIAQGDADLAQGVTVTLSRGGSALGATLGADGKTAAAKILAGVDANGVMSLHVDVHNDESPAHILLWSGDSFDEDQALLNSEVDGETPGQGKGTFWGLQLADATVTAARMLDAKFVEE